MEIVNDYEIMGTLDFGIKLKKSFFIFISFCFLILAVVCIIPVICNIFYDVGLVLGEEIALILFSLVFFFIVVITCLFYVRQKKFFINSVGEFLNDPLLYKTKALISEFSRKGSVWDAQYRVKAEFSYNDEKILLVGNKFCKRFNRYIDKEINILYSPKYAQVIVLKN